MEMELQVPENNLLTGLVHSVPETNFSGMAVDKKETEERGIAVIIRSKCMCLHEFIIIQFIV